MDSLPATVGNSAPCGDFLTGLKSTLNAIFEPVIAAQATCILAELGVKSEEMAAGVAATSGSNFRELTPQSVYEQGRAVITYPFDKVVEACIWARSNAAKKHLKTQKF